MTTAAAPPAATREALGPTLVEFAQEGLPIVVVDAATGDAACDHIFEDGVAAFCAEQSEHGYACYQCHTDTVQ